MNQDITKRLREIAAAQRATLCEELSLAPSPDGSLALIEVTDHAGRAAILIPSTQLPQLAAQLLDLWTQCSGEGRDAAVVSNLEQQRAAMEQCAVPASGAAVRSVQAGFMTLAVDISGIPLFLDVPVAAAQKLAAGIMVGVEAHGVGDDERH